PALLDLLELLSHALDGSDQVAGEHQHARIRKKRRHLLLDPLDARAAADEAFGRLALRARRLMRHGEAAVVADELAAKAVVDQPSIAMWAGEAKPAGAAQGEWRIAAPVEKQERLLLALDRDLHRLGEARRDEPPARRALAGEVNRLDRRQMRAAEAFRQAQPAIAPTT